MFCLYCLSGRPLDSQSRDAGFECCCFEASVDEHSVIDSGGNMNSLRAVITASLNAPREVELVSQ